MKRWLSTARTIVATASVTSAAWLIGGAIWPRDENERWAPEAAAPVLGFRNTVAGSRSDPASAGQTVGQTGYVTPSVSGLRPGSGLTIPVSGVRAGELVDTFTQSRAGGLRDHDAIDIMAPRGARVVAAGPGQVEKLFYSADGGKTIYVRSPDRTLIYYYAHLDTYAPGLTEKQWVRVGQVLGTVGATGNANPAGPHLHFAVMRTSPTAKWYTKAEPLNPFPLLTASAGAVARAEPEEPRR